MRVDKLLLITYRVTQMVLNNFLQPFVQLVAMFVQDHGVGVPVELFETQPTVVLLLDLLDGVLQQIPRLLHVLVIHGGLKCIRLSLTTQL